MGVKATKFERAKQYAHHFWDHDVTFTPTSAAYVSMFAGPNAFWNTLTWFVSVRDKSCSCCVLVDLRGRLPNETPPRLPRFPVFSQAIVLSNPNLAYSQTMPSYTPSG